MNKEQAEILKTELGLEFSPLVHDKLERWEKLFREFNSHTNLMSKGDVEKLFEKHVFDSLALVKCPAFKPYEPLTTLDIGTGGGFPSVILAICFENVHVTAADSIVKKINFLNLIKKEFDLKNLVPIASRVEDLPPQNVDFILSRATARLSKLVELSKKHMRPGTKLLLHKAKTAQEELLELGNLGKRAKIFNYTLPLPEKHTRCLILIDKI
ncbi:16S rRNA (guanine527-N7)-methyltransferase [Candidatus Gastranaerophilus sp. (ex Termes propinquus)]|nr:16S rRNA (guanine527-N7)-methyltransferase [Candidatus Gastranaerophilus sp. (ex Termes propinquus)]